MSHPTPYSNIDIVIFATGPTFPDPAFCSASTYGEVGIVNRGILEHVLLQAEKDEFPNVTLVCLDKDKHAYHIFLTSTQHDRVRLVSLAPDDDPDPDAPRSTCAILRKLSSGRHIIVVPIDLVTTTKFSPIVDFHLAHKSSITMVACETVFPNELNKEAPSGVTKASGPDGFSVELQPGIRYPVYDESDPTRLVTLLSNAAAIASDVDLAYLEGSDSGVEERMTIHQAHLSRCRSLIVDGSKRFPGLFVVAPSALNFLTLNAQYHSIESELIPGLCLEAERRIELELAKRLESEKPRNPEEPKKRKDEKKVEKPEPLPVVSLLDLPKEEYAFRICDYRSLYIANMMAARKQLKGFVPPYKFTPLSEGDGGYYKADVKLGFPGAPNCVYGPDITIAEGVTITESIIGKGCIIGEGCTLVNVVMFPGAKLAPKVHLKNCVIGALSEIGAGCQFTKCVMACGSSCLPGRKEVDSVVLSDVQPAKADPAKDAK